MTTYVDLQLDLGEFVSPTYAPELTIQQRWEMWRDANPWVLPYIADLLDDWSAHGGRRVGVKAAVEWARYHYTRQTRGSVWKFDNSHSSRLARDLIAAYPHLAAVIETRELRAA
jgi:hypothetical protein